MDDGLQSKDIKKDFKILVKDAQYQFGNELILPAGPLRQPINKAIKKCDVILEIRDEIRYDYQEEDSPKYFLR